MIYLTIEHNDSPEDTIIKAERIETLATILADEFRYGRDVSEWTISSSPINYTEDEYEFREYVNEN